MKTVRIACDVEATIPLEDIEPFQGDLKDIKEEDLLALCNEIMTTGFAFPVKVWRKGKRKVKIIGGHQSIKALCKLRDEGWRDPEGALHDVEVPAVPVVFIHAKNEQEAARRVLQDVSQYGRVTASGLQGFAERHELNLKSIATSFRMPDLKIENLMRALANPPTRKVEFTIGAPKNVEEKKGDVTCPRCKHHFPHPPV